MIHNAEELQSYYKREEDKLETIIKGIADAGVRVVASGSAIGEMALHFLEKYQIMAVRIPSKFELRRFCRYFTIPFALRYLFLIEELLISFSRSLGTISLRLDTFGTESGTLQTSRKLCGQGKC